MPVKNKIGNNNQHMKPDNFDPVMLVAFVREVNRVRATHFYFCGKLNYLI